MPELKYMYIKEIYSELSIEDKKEIFELLINSKGHSKIFSRKSKK